METDDKLKWLEGRINSSLRPRTDELKQMFLNDENRFVFIHHTISLLVSVHALISENHMFWACLGIIVYIPIQY